MLLVITNHAWGWPAGGFVGVDIFFVISGFVITQGFLREGRTHDSISIADFYRRRVRRIIPAAFLVLVATVTATYYVYGSGRGGNVLKDAGWAAGMVANWHFSAVETDYFARTTTLSPVQHYWSLAVEEQYYLIWPLLLSILLYLSLRFERGIRYRPAAFALTLTVASLAYSLWHTASNPTAAYFSSIDRAWELGIGAFVASALPQLEKIPLALRGITSWVGLAAITAGAAIVPESPGFPAPWALLPTLGTALILVGPWRSGWRLAPLTNPVSGYLGRISYSLYLWHLPVLIVGAVLLDVSRPLDAATYVALTLGLSALSFHALEDPVRHSEWLEPRWRRTAAPNPHATKLGIVGLSALALLVSGFSYYSVQAAEDPSTSSLYASPSPSSDPLQPSAGSPQERQTQLLLAALSLETFPDFQPDVTGLPSWSTLLAQEVCIDVPPDDLSRCSAGPADASRTALLVGDSFAIAYAPGVQAALADSGWRVVQYTLQSCPWWGTTVVHENGTPYPECDGHNGDVGRIMSEVKPDLVVLSASPAEAIHLASGATRDAALNEIRTAAVATVRRISAGGVPVAILDAPPPTPDLSQCVSRFTTPHDCEGRVPAASLAFAKLDADVAADTGTTAVAVIDWLCYLGRCPGIVNGIAVRSDIAHLTPQFSRQLAPLLRSALLAAYAAQAQSR